MDCYNTNSIIIKHGFVFGADFNISCREWNMLISKEWIIDNVMNRALALLKKMLTMVKNTGYLIPIKWSILCVLKRELNGTLIFL